MPSKNSIRGPDIDCLPDGWVMTTLGEVRLDKSKSIDPSKLSGQVFELYSVPSFSDRQPEIVPGNTVGSSKRTVEPNSVLLCKINPRINRVWVVRDYSQYRKIASTEWLCFSELGGILPDFLCHYMRQDSFREYLASNASGVGGSLMRVRDTTFSNYPFLLPPLPEQHRIVAEIEKQFTRLDSAVAALKRVQANLKRYRASVLKAACEGKLVPTEAETARAEGRDYEPADRLLERILAERRARWEAQERRRGKYKEAVAPNISNLPTLPMGWTWATLDQLATIGTGSTPLTSKSEYYQKGSVPWVTSSALNDPAVSSPGNYVTQQAVEEYRLFLYPKHTLLIAMYGEGKTRGKCSELMFPSTINQAIAAVTMEDAADECRPYCKVFLQGNYEATRRLSSGGVQPNLNLGLIKGLALPLPPLAEQRRIVAEVERRLSVVDQAEATAEANLTRAERLRQSILKQAFSGKLVPQDPREEPASDLLERIRAEREAAQTASKPKSRAKHRKARSSSERQLVLGVQEKTP